MPLTPGWDELALRLALAALAGGLIGFDRDEHGRPAGLRTTLLVCLAAATAMILANLLLPTVTERTAGPFTFDVLRLPLGVLSGMGFLGAGAIVRRNDLVLGLTTAATLWMVTIIGLAFGSGQLALGAAVTGLALAVVWGLKHCERFMPRELRASLVLIAGADGPSREQAAAQITAAGFRIAGEAVIYGDGGQTCETHFDLAWRGTRRDVAPPPFVPALARQPGVRKLQWVPQGVPLS